MSDDQFKMIMQAIQELSRDLKEFKIQNDLEHQKIFGEIKEIRNELNETRQDLNETRQEMHEIRQNLHDTRQDLNRIGEINIKDHEDIKNTYSVLYEMFGRHEAEILKIKRSPAV